MTASRAAEGEPGAGHRHGVTSSRPPYRGLERYTESDDDAALFFGRDSGSRSQRRTSSPPG